MLYADKAALENRTKLRLLAIRERELTLYTQNCFTIGTVSALMAGLAYSSLLYTKMDYFQDATAFVQAMYVMGNVISMYLALRAMTGTTMIAMFGPGKALRGPDGSMHETVDAMLEEFEKAGISFQGCLYSFVFCLLVYAWSATKAGSTALCVLSLSAMAIFTVYCMVVRTKEVETTFPLYSIPLVSGAFFNKKAGAGGANGVLDPAASVQAEVQAEAQATDPPAATSTPAAARPPPARVAVPPPRSRGGKHGARDAGTPVLMADRAPALPPAIAARHAEQQRLVAEARVRAVERKAVDKEAGQTRQKDGKWFTRLRDR